MPARRRDRLSPWARFAVLVAFCIVPPLDAATKYVAKTGSDSNDGSCITSPYLTITKGFRNTVEP